MAIVYTILACAAYCNGQKHHIGTDLVSGICSGTIELRVSHSFAPHWSAGADVCINLGTIIKTVNEVTQAHENALKDSGQTIGNVRKAKDFLREICIHTEYWPISPFNGPSVCIGGRIRDTGTPDMTVGAGYSFKIVKGLGADIRYMCGIIEACTTGKLPADGIKAGIYYVF